MSAGEDNRPTCLRCGKAQPLLLNQPCGCGCWWLALDGGARHVGDALWPGWSMVWWAYRDGRSQGVDQATDEHPGK